MVLKSAIYEALRQTVLKY